MCAIVAALDAGDAGGGDADANESEVGEDVSTLRICFLAGEKKGVQELGVEGDGQETLLLPPPRVWRPGEPFRVRVGLFNEIGLLAKCKGHEGSMQCRLRSVRASDGLESMDEADEEEEATIDGYPSGVRVEPRQLTISWSEAVVEVDVTLTLASAPRPHRPKVQLVVEAETPDTPWRRIVLSAISRPIELTEDATLLERWPQVQNLRAFDFDVVDGLEIRRRIRVPVTESPADVGFFGVAWDCGIALCEYLLHRPQLWRDRHICDLGAGTGLVTMALARSGVSFRSITALETDELVPLLAANVLLAASTSASATDGDAGGDADTHVSVGAYMWGEDAPRLLRTATTSLEHSDQKQEEGQTVGEERHERFDLILCSDCVFDPMYWSELWQAFKALTQPGSTVILAYPPRQPQEVQFFDMADRALWDVQRVPYADRESRSPSAPTPRSYVWTHADDIHGGGGDSSAQERVCHVYILTRRAL